MTRAEKINSIENELMQRSNFEELIYSITENKMEEAKKLIPNYPKDWVHRMLCKASEFKLFSLELYGELFKYAGETELTY